jgi:hypothetical protein
MYQILLLFWNIQKIQQTERPVQDVFLLYELNATRHHRCGNETKSDGLVLWKLRQSGYKFFKLITSGEFCI